MYLSLWALCARVHVSCMTMCVCVSGGVDEWVCVCSCVCVCRNRGECAYAYVHTLWVCVCTCTGVLCVDGWRCEGLCTQLCASVPCTDCGHCFLAACLSAPSCILQQRPQGCAKKAMRLPFVSCLSSAGPAGRQGEGVLALVLHAKAALKTEEGWLSPGGGSPGLPLCSQLLAPLERLMEKALVAMRKIFHRSIPVPHKKNLLHIIHIFQCNYPQPTHTAWRIKT